ncbi:MAG: 50S ribosomal protein L25 [bacterium]|nr:50S ribosomal protein L25 [bacterium]
MVKHTLTASPRQVVGRKVKQLRSQGQVPANVFGQGTASVNLQVSEKEISNLLKDAGESTLIYLQIAGEKTDRPVMLAEISRNPVTDLVQHIGLRQVNLQEKTTAAVPVKLVGEAPAEAEKLGILVQQLHDVDVEALPTDMPDELDVDVTGLVAVDSAVYVKNIKANAKIKIITDAEALVAKIEPLAAEEPKEAPVPAEGEAPVEGEAGVEGEKPAEGETKAEEATGEKE